MASNQAQIIVLTLKNGKKQRFYGPCETENGLVSAEILTVEAGPVVELPPEYRIVTATFPVKKTKNEAKT